MSNRAFFVARFDYRLYSESAWVSQPGWHNFLTFAVCSIMRLPDEPDLPAQINIVPMIDVVFALLTFFIMSSLVLTRSEGLPINLPESSTSKSPGNQPIEVTIDQKGQLSVNRSVITIAQVAQQVQALLPTDRNTVVVINADARVSHGQVVTVMDQIRRIQGVKLAIKTQRAKN
jgi:biopolymer transport protein ExbD